MMTSPSDMVATHVIELVLNQYLSLDSLSQKKMNDLSGKVIAIELTGLDITRYCVFTDDGIMIQQSLQGEPDTLLRGTPMALGGLAFKGDQQQSFFSGEVEIIGDIRLGERFNRIIDGIDIDWEEKISMVVGDIAAHKLGYFARQFRDWSNNTRTSFAEDVKDYLREESTLLPYPEEVEYFLAQVDILRSDVERLELRVNRMVNRMKAKSE